MTPRRLFQVEATYVAVLCIAAIQLKGQGTPITPRSRAPLNVILTQITQSPGSHSNPHVDGDWASYDTLSGNNYSSSLISYYNFPSTANSIVPASLSTVRFSDVQGGRIVFTSVAYNESRIVLYDIATGASMVINPQPGTLRDNASIGSNTVAYLEKGTGNVVVAYDLTSGRAANLGTYQWVFGPNVSPNGNIIAWAGCADLPPYYLSCEILMAAKGLGGNWTVSALPSPSGPSRTDQVKTDGQFVVYDAADPTNANQSDIYVYNIATGNTERLNTNLSAMVPSISHGFVTFMMSDPASIVYVPYLYDIQRNLLYQLTNTSSLFLPEDDISVLSNGQIRIVWAGYVYPGPAQWNVYAATIPKPCVPRQVVLDASISYPPIYLWAAPTYHDAVARPHPPLTFHLPGRLPVVKGNADTGLSQLSISIGRRVTSCLYQGANNGTEYDMLGCRPPLRAGSQVSADTLDMRVWDADFREGTTEVRVELDDATCAP